MKNIKNMIRILIQVSILVALVKATPPKEPCKREVIGEFWDKPNFCGKSIKLYENERIQHLLNWRKKISSFKIFKPVSIFNDVYGGGECLHLEPGTYVTHKWCNRISSIFDTKTLKNISAELYEHKNFCGRKILLANGERLQWIGCPWNNKFSSIIVHDGAITACDKFFGEGKCQGYKKGKIEDLCKLHFNDRISSVYDENDDKIVGYFYEHPKFCGRVIKLYENERLTSLAHLNDKISSYKVVKPIVVCEHYFHEGKCRTLAPGECGSLEHPWNNKISSIYDEL